MKNYLLLIALVKTYSILDSIPVRAGIITSGVLILVFITIVLIGVFYRKCKYNHLNIYHPMILKIFPNNLLHGY